jgi:hypothetical protein
VSTSPPASERQGCGEKDAKAGEQPPELVWRQRQPRPDLFPRLPGRVTLEKIDANWPGLIEGLVNHEGVGTIMGCSDKRGAVAPGKDGFNFDSNKIDGVDPLAIYGEYAVDGMKRVDGMSNCPDIVAISLLNPATDEVGAFEELIGSHGGLGGDQTKPFLLHPADWTIDEPIVGAEAVYR